MKVIDFRNSCEPLSVNIDGGSVIVEGSLLSRLTDSNIKSGNPAFTGFNTLKVAQETQIFEEGWAEGIDTDEVWDLTESGDGTVVVTDGQGVFQVLSDGDEASIQTKLPHIFLHGFSTIWRIATYNSRSTIIDGAQEFGPHDVNNGYLFRIDNAGLNVVIRRKTLETVVNIPGFAAGRHGYAIQYLDGNQVRFYVDNVLVHAAISGFDNLIAASNVPTTIKVTQTGATGTSILKAFGLAVIREGAPNSYNNSGELRVSSGVISTPPGADKILRPVGDPLVVLSPNQVLDDFYTITNGKSLVVQQLRARVESAGTGKSVRVELFSDPDGDNPVGPANNQPASWIRIDTLMGNNFNQDAAQDETLTGDGTARVVLRLQQTGSATIAVEAILQGFEI